jgi:hypothetical protein
MAKKHIQNGRYQQISRQYVVYDTKWQQKECSCRPAVNYFLQFNVRSFSVHFTELLPASIESDA